MNKAMSAAAQIVIELGDVCLGLAPGRLTVRLDLRITGPRHGAVAEPERQRCKDLVTGQL